jgi:multidrug resistance protein, MATE family
MASDLIFTTIPLGLGVASSHRIGNLLGAGDAKSAKFALRMPYILASFLGLIEFFILISVRNVYGRIFTDSGPVIALTAHIIPLMAGFQVLDIGNGGAGGNLRGAGKNHLSAVCNLVGYYGVGLTTAWYLCFEKGFGLFGLWAGIITGSWAVLILQTTCLALVDWAREAEDISGGAKCDIDEGPNTLLDASC